jgi:transcriptional regulator with XRE-family HTH domain
MRRLLTMDRDEQPEAGWPIDLEVTVARNVRLLREGRGVSQQQLGSDLFRYGFGMNQTTVAELETGAKSLRLNEVAAIAAYFEVPIESLWQEGAETLTRILDERLGAAQAADVEKMAADYYTQQRIERLRDK